MEGLIIGTIGSLFAMAIGFSIRIIWEYFPYETITRARCKVLKGKWQGKIYSIDIPAEAKSLVPPDFDINFQINSVFWKRVRAESQFASFQPDRGPIINDYKGGFYLDRYLILKYRKRDKYVTGFGAMILELSPCARKLSGKVIGYGSHIKDLFCSKIELVKI